MSPNNVRISSIRLNTKQDVARVRQVGEAVTKRLGFSPFDRTRITTAMIELARNVLRHAESGRIALSLNRYGDRAAIGVSATDTGSGMPEAEIAAALGDGEREGFGLQGVRRLADHFDLHSSANGTQVDATFMTGHPASDMARLAKQIAADVAALGETDPAATLAQQNQELLEALRERELLIAEVHHRTRNNLSLIASFVRLARNGATQDETQRVLEDLDGRIHAVLSVHRHLERDGGEDALLVVPFLDSVSDGTRSAFSSNKRKVSIAVTGDAVTVPQQTAIDLGLIVGELLTNALKHAFVGKEAGRIGVHVAAEEDGGLLVEVADDGVGLPDGVKRPERSTSLGWRMIRSMTQRYDGHIETGGETGLRVRIRLGAATQAQRRVADS